MLPCRHVRRRLPFTGLPLCSTAHTMPHLLPPPPPAPPCPTATFACHILLFHHAPHTATRCDVGRCGTSPLAAMVYLNYLHSPPPVVRTMDRRTFAALSTPARFFGADIAGARPPAKDYHARTRTGRTQTALCVGRQLPLAHSCVSATAHLPGDGGKTATPYHPGCRGAKRWRRVQQPSH